MAFASYEFVRRGRSEASGFITDLKLFEKWKGQP